MCTSLCPAKQALDHGGEALIGLAGAHCDAFELLEPTEEILDEMPPVYLARAQGERSLGI
jgi:hypothetical protein